MNKLKFHRLSQNGSLKVQRYRSTRGSRRHKVNRAGRCRAGPRDHLLAPN
jgi:hypothetical protein